LDENLKTKLLFEISQIDRLIDESKPLLDLCKSKTPSHIEMSAAALLLHSFYLGIENVLVLIFKGYNEKVIEGAKWHIEILDKAFISNKNRKQIFREELKESLDGYLKFRHLIRHTYSYQLEWSRMENLIKGIESAWKEVKENLNEFINQ
jgi:hypothetical protein